MPHIFITDSDFSTIDKNFRYILWFQPSFWAIILWKNKIDIFLDLRYIERVKSIDKEKLIRRVWVKNKKNDFKINYIEFWNWSFGLFSQLKEVLKKEKKIILENNIAVKYVNKLKWDYKMIFKENYFLEKRLFKEEREQTKIKTAIKIIDIVYIYLKYLIASWEIVWMREIEVRNKIAMKILELWWRKESFESIIAFWANSAIPHHSSGETKIGNGVLLIDIGAEFWWYCSDFTRVFWIWKKNKQYYKYKEVYDIVKNAHQRVLDNFEIWMKAKDIDKIARDFIIESWYENNFTHSLWHWIWLQVHEKPSIDKFSDEEIKENMVFTIEPWIYIKEEFWVRLEDVVFVKDGRLKKYTTINF